MPRKKSVLPKLKLKQRAIVGVATLVSIALAVVAIASFFTEPEKLGAVKNFLTNAFGWCAPLIPVLLVSMGLSLQKLKWWIASLNTFVGFLTFSVAAIGLMGGIGVVQGGVVGVFVWSELVSILSGFGSAVLLLIIMLIGFVVLFNISLKELFGIFPSIFGAASKVSIPKPTLPEFKTLNTPMKVSGIDERIPVKVETNKKESIMPETIVQNVAGANRVWKYPPLNILSEKGGSPADRGDVKKNAHIIESTLDSFGIQARVAEVNAGPAVTQYALDIAAGTKITKIANLQNDIALALATKTGTVRIEAPIPGKSLVGIEVPNHSLEMVTLRSVMGSSEMSKHKSRLAVCLGKDTGSNPVIVDIDKMPHALVAGTTGSGKSVLMHSLICSLLFRNSPDELKLIMIDPKRVEMTNYNNIPHLLAPVIVEPEKILSALKWATQEMERRYKLFQQVGVRNIEAYNVMSGFQSLPFIVILIDELADLMMFAPIEVEDAITRLAQLARATGIHLVLATQRPSVDVITGLMKANIPARIAFNVSSMIDSRVIIDQGGAEKLLGRGDMLFLPPDASKPMRVQGVYVSDSEINGLVTYLKNMGIPPTYSTEITDTPVSVGKGKGAKSFDSGDQDGLFEDAVRVVAQSDKASATLLQRKLRVGYARAARILDELEQAGIVGAGDGAKPRDVIMHNAAEYLSGATDPGAEN